MIDLSVPKRNLSIAVHHVACRAAAAVPRRRGVLVDEAARDYAGAAELRRPGAPGGPTRNLKPQILNPNQTTPNPKPIADLLRFRKQKGEANPHFFSCDSCAEK